MNNNKKTIILDFDGTMANTLDTMVDIYNRIAFEYGCKQVNDGDRDKLRRKKPQQFLKDYGLSWWKLPRVVLRIRKELNQNIDEIKIVRDMDTVLRQLKERGYTMGILTSNSKKNIKVFLEHYGLENIFDFIHSSKNVYGKDQKILNILKLKRLKREDVVYVGDETRDIEACRKVGIKIIAVSWGFNKKEILQDQNPDTLIDKPNQLLDFFQSSV